MLCQSFLLCLFFPPQCQSGSHNLNDPVQVIGHNHKTMQINSSKMQRNRCPAFANNAPKRGQVNARLDNSAKDAPLVIGTEGHEVKPWSRVISMLQSPRLRHGLSRGLDSLPRDTGAACCATTTDTLLQSRADFDIFGERR